MLNSIRLTEIEMVKYEKYVLDEAITLKKVFMQNVEVSMKRKKYMFAVPEVANIQILMGLDEHLYVKNLNNNTVSLLQKRSSEDSLEKEKNYYYTFFYITDDDLLEIRVYYERPQMVELAGYEKQYIYMSDIEEPKVLEFERCKDNEDGPEKVELELQSDGKTLDVKYAFNGKRMVKKVGLSGDKVATFIPTYMTEEAYGSIEYSILKIGNENSKRKTIELELSNYEKNVITVNNSIADSYNLSFKRKRGCYYALKEVHLGFLIEKDMYTVKVRGKEKKIKIDPDRKVYTALVEVLDNECYLLTIKEL